MANEKTRDTNIELLRILAMVGVVVLHLINPVMAGGLNYVREGNWGSALAMNMLTAIFVCAVNVYVLISGYFLCTSNKRNLTKVLELLFLVLLSQLFLFTRPLSFSVFLKNLLPNNWFVVLYVVLYLISPYLNVVIEKLDKKQYILMLAILGSLFALYPTIADFIGNRLNGSFVSTISSSGSQSGYTIVNFVLIYFVGGYLRKFGLKEIKTPFVLIGFIACSLIILGWSYLDSATAYAYCNPVVIIQAVLIFVLFKRMKIKSLKPILYLSQASFMVYLTHIGLIQYAPLSAFANSNFFIVILCMLAIAVIIYLIGVAIYTVYKFTLKLLFNKLSKCEKLKIEYFNSDKDKG